MIINGVVNGYGNGGATLRPFLIARCTLALCVKRCGNADNSVINSFRRISSVVIVQPATGRPLEYHRLSQQFVVHSVDRCSAIIIKSIIRSGIAGDCTMEALPEKTASAPPTKDD